MKFDSPAGANPIDREKVIGQPLDRLDGPLKVCGAATYAYEWHDRPGVAYGVVVGSAIAKGRIRSVDSSEVDRAPGVLAVVTAANAGPLKKSGSNDASLLGGPHIEHYDQAVALVVAETFEQARDAAKLVRVDYINEIGRFDLDEERRRAGAASAGSSRPAARAGDFEGAFANAAVKLDAVYTTPDQSHMMMEPHATLAWWEGEKLVLRTSSQMVATGVQDMATTLGIPAENIHFMSPYVGGGFGAKLWIRADALLAALGSRRVGRPVKVALARPQIANNTVHRPATIQRIRLGTDRNGVIEAIAHESWSGNLPGGSTEMAAQQTRLLYRGHNRLIAHYLAHLDLPEGNSMRAPGEAVGMLALEAAMDELAEMAGVDPVELRIRNDISYDPMEGPSRPFSSRKFVECLQVGAERFGWQRRDPVPGSRREGRWLIGMGMAAAFRGAPVQASGARVKVDGEGRVVVETDMTDIGTGSYTIIGQTAAEMMGVSLDRVTVRLGDSNFPVSSGSGGQFGASSSTAGVYAACVALRRAIAQRAGFNSEDAEFADGCIVSGGRRVTLADAVGADGLAAEDRIEFGSLTRDYAQATFGAHFAEVGVDAATGEVRVRRQCGAFAAGRILNPKTARSQVAGSMTMGAGAALMEALMVDRRFGYFVNHDLAEYHIPVHADVAEQEVVFLDELDDKASPMKAKGVGELGICGAGAAVANAIYNATGIRVRDYPITVDKLVDKLAAM